MHREERKITPQAGPEHKVAATCLETKRRGEGKESSEVILTSFKFASVNLEIIFCKEAN